MKPEKIDDKFVSYATGQLESASPLSKWIIDACDKVKEYNAIPEEKRPNHSAVLKGTDNEYYHGNDLIERALVMYKEHENE